LIVALNDASLEIADRQEAKQEEIFSRLKGEFQEVQQALQSSRVVSTVPLTIETIGTGDEPTQLRQIAEKVEARLRRAQEDTAQATQALAQVQSAHIVQQRKEEQEQLALQVKWEEEKAQLQQSKDQLLAEQLEVQERVHRALRSVTVIEVKIEERVPQQVAQLEEVIQQLQQRIIDLELRTMPETPQEVRDLREATARSAVGRLKTLALECKQLSARSTQTYENLTENPELQTLEAQLQEAKKHADTLQAQLKALTPVERMKQFPEQCTAQQQVHMLQSKVMEVSQ
jgi:chromosome segregation ATPase